MVDVFVSLKTGLFTHVESLAQLYVDSEQPHHEGEITINEDYLSLSVEGNEDVLVEFC